MTIILYILAIAGLLLLLYFFQQTIIKYFAFFPASIYLYFLFFLPGVIFHELSHLFMAAILGVPSGRFKIFPKKTEEGWSLGQVSSAETDLIRSSLIGLAPMIVGSTGVILIANLALGIKQLADVFTLSPTWFTFFCLYFILALTNTMFLSEEDRSSAWVFPSLLIFLFFFLRAMGWVGILLAIEGLFSQITEALILSFSLTVLLDFLFLIFLFFLTQILVMLKR